LVSASAEDLCESCGIKEGNRIREIQRTKHGGSKKGVVALPPKKRSTKQKPASKKRPSRKKAEKKPSPPKSDSASE